MSEAFDASNWNRTYQIGGKVATARILQSKRLESGAIEVVVQAGCRAPDGNIHYQTNATTLIEPAGGPPLEAFMQNCARWIHQLVWEKPVIKMYVLDVLKSNGELMHLPCTINVAQSHTFVDPMFIELAGAPHVGGIRFAENPSIELPRHRVGFRFREQVVEADVIAAKMGGASAILGGQLVQQATNGDVDILFQLFMSDIVRAVNAAARCKRTAVLILGSFSDVGRERLQRIRSALQKAGLRGVQLDDFIDIHQQSLYEKMLMFGSLSGFIVCDESAASGHLIELKACADIGFVTAILRHQGKPVTWMNFDIATDRAYLKMFPYTEETLETAVEDAVRWAQQKVIERAEFYNREYPWRNPNVQLG